MVGFRHLLLAVLFHLAVIAMLSLSVQCSEKIEPPPAIVAVMVSEVPKGPRSPRPDPALTQAPEPAKEAPPDPSASINDQSVQRQEEQAREQERLREERRAAEAQQRAEAEAKREAEQAEARKQAEIALKLAADEKARREQAERQAEEQAEAEAREKAEAEAARLKSEAEQKRKQEEQRKAADQRRRQQELAQMIAAEEEADYVSGVQRTWADDIREAIRSQWLRPPGLSDELVCRVQVELLPNGQVISVQITDGSGVIAFDDSVEKAIVKADPLPTPTDPKAFVRVLNLTFTPKDFY